MSIISVNLGDEHLAKADAIARILSESYGVPVSRSEIIRRAIIAFPMPVRSRTLSGISATTTADHLTSADRPPLDPPPRES
jgi:hypothetical protein